MSIRRIFENDLGPSLESLLGNVQLPVDFAEKRSFISINFRDLESRHLAPGFRGVVAVLQVLGSQYESCKEHPSAAHESAVGWTVHLLFLCEVILWNE